MTIGELLISLGFDIQGIEDLRKAKKDVEETASVATKAAIGVDSLVAGLAVMVGTAMHAADSLQRFELTTGLSATALQQWTYRAAVAKVSAQEMTDSIKGIQAAGVKVSTTGEGAAPWVLLGIDPRQNPFLVLNQLQKELQSVDSRRVALARQIVSQAGIPDSVFAMLRRPDVGNLPGRFVVNDQDRQAMNHLNAEWERLGFLISQAKNNFSAELAPELTKGVILMEKLVDGGAKFVEWLEIHPNVAKGIADVTIGIGLLGGALTTAAAAAKALNFTLGLLGPSVAAGAAAQGAAGAAAEGVAGAAAARGAVRIGQSLPVAGLVITASAVTVETQRLWLNSEKEKVDAAKAKGMSDAEIQRKIPSTSLYYHPERGSFDSPAGAEGGEAMASLFRHMFRSFVNATASSVRVEQNNEFTIHEAASAKSTASQVGDTLHHQLQSAALGTEPPNY